MSLTVALNPDPCPNPADVLCEESNFTNDKIIATCNVNRHAEWPNPIIMLISHNPPRK